jgi:reactive intermediate/imine deaminase
MAAVVTNPAEAERMAATLQDHDGLTEAATPSKTMQDDDVVEEAALCYVSYVMLCSLGCDRRRPPSVAGSLAAFGFCRMSSHLTAAIAGAAAGGLVAYALMAHDRRSRGRRPYLEAVTTANASPAGGHYAQAIKNGGEVFVSGLLPITANGDKLSGAPFEEQAEAVLRNLDAILLAAGSSLSKLISVRVYITDVSNWGTFNRLYAERLGAHKPARAVVPVPALHFGVLLEVEAVAAM